MVLFFVFGWAEHGAAEGVGCRIRFTVAQNDSAAAFSQATATTRPTERVEACGRTAPAPARRAWRPPWPARPTRSARVWSSMVQPTTRREQPSRTAHKCSQHCPVQIRAGTLGPDSVSNRRSTRSIVARGRTVGAGGLGRVLTGVARPPPSCGTRAHRRRAGRAGSAAALTPRAWDSDLGRPPALGHAAASARATGETLSVIPPAAHASA